MGTGSFPGVKNGRCVTLTPHPLLVPWSWKSRTIPLLPLWAVRPVQSLSACTGVELYFYSPYGPYGLYRASVPVQGWSYTFTPPMGHTACTEPQCLYKGALYVEVGVRLLGLQMLGFSVDTSWAYEYVTGLSYS